MIGAGIYPHELYQALGSLSLAKRRDKLAHKANNPCLQGFLVVWLWIKTVRGPFLSLETNMLGPFWVVSSALCLYNYFHLLPLPPLLVVAKTSRCYTCKWCRRNIGQRKHLEPVKSVLLNLFWKFIDWGTLFFLYNKLSEIWRSYFPGNHASSTETNASQKSHLIQLGLWQGFLDSVEMDNKTAGPKKHRHHSGSSDGDGPIPLHHHTSNKHA